MSRESVDSGHLQWLEAMKANDPVALARLVTDDVVLMPPHIQPVVGRQGVIDWFATVVSQVRTKSVEIRQREVTLAGEWAIERGSFTWKVTPAPGGSDIDDQGSFLAIWQRQPDGSWKVTRNIWNSTLPRLAIT
jgi:ketosteroid isomerase-like protein